MGPGLVEGSAQGWYVRWHACVAVESTDEIVTVDGSAYDDRRAVEHDVRRLDASDVHGMEASDVAE